MSKAHLCYPYSIHSIRVAYILNDGKFIEDTAIFRIGKFESGYGSISKSLFKNINIDGSEVTCHCINDNQKITLETNFRCGYCRCKRGVSVFLNGDGKIGFYPTKYQNTIDSIICDCNKSCLIIDSQINAFYRESDFEPKQPYRDPNAPIAAAIFGGLFGGVAGIILGQSGIPVVGLSGWTAATGLSPTAVLTGVLGGGGAISSYFATLNISDGSVCVNLPTINIGNCNGRDVNEIGVPIYLRESDYQHFETNTSKNDLINKINNHPITTLIAQYPRLFKKI